MGNKQKMVMFGVIGVLILIIVYLLIPKGPGGGKPPVSPQNCRVEFDRLEAKFKKSNSFFKKDKNAIRALKTYLETKMINDCPEISGEIIMLIGSCKEALGE